MTGIAPLPPDDSGRSTTPLDDLTPRERALVEYHVEHGGPVIDAITHAGYAHPNGGYQAWQRDRVRAAVAWLSRERLGSLVPSALSALSALVAEAKSEKVRLDAALAVLDRAGMSPSGPASDPGAVGSVTINIDLSGEGSDRAVISATQANAQAGGKNAEGPALTTSAPSAFQDRKPAGGGR